MKTHTHFPKNNYTSLFSESRVVHLETPANQDAQEESLSERFGLETRGNLRELSEGIVNGIIDFSNGITRTGRKMSEFFTKRGKDIQVVGEGFNRDAEKLANTAVEHAKGEYERAEAVANLTALQIYFSGKEKVQTGQEVLAGIQSIFKWEELERRGEEALAQRMPSKTAPIDEIKTRRQELAELKEQLRRVQNAITAQETSNATVATVATVAKEAVPVVTRGVEFEDNLYTVQSGDTLGRIAAQYPGVSWRDIYKANRDIIGDDPNKIVPGQRFRIPSPGGASRQDTQIA